MKKRTPKIFGIPQRNIDKKLKIIDEILIMVFFRWFYQGILIAPVKPNT